MLTVLGLVTLYLLAGWFMLPAVLKWQAEKWVLERLDHRLVVAEVQFDPLAFELEVRGLTLADKLGRPLFELQRLFVDLDVSRSLADRAWGFAAVTLDAPAVHVELDPAGEHNFAALMHRLRAQRTQAQDDAAMSRWAVASFRLNDGLVDVADASLAPPLITRIAPLVLQVDAMSNFAQAPARYHLSAPSAAGESFDARGALAVNPFAVHGKMVLDDLRFDTLVRALSRQFAVGSAAGRINLAGTFDVAVDDAGRLTGSAEQIALAVTGLLLRAPGGGATLLTIRDLALSGGAVDLDQRQASLAELKWAGGQVSAAIDAQGRSGLGAAASQPRRHHGRRVCRIDVRAGRVATEDRACRRVRGGCRLRRRRPAAQRPCRRTDAARLTEPGHRRGAHDTASRQPGAGAGGAAVAAG